MPPFDKVSRFSATRCHAAVLIVALARAAIEASTIGGRRRKEDEEMRLLDAFGGSGSDANYKDNAAVTIELEGRPLGHWVGVARKRARILVLKIPRNYDRKKDPGVFLDSSATYHVIQKARGSANFEHVVFDLVIFGGRPIFRDRRQQTSGMFRLELDEPSSSP